MKKLLFALLLIPLALVAQEPTFKDGIPDDLEMEKLIFLEHEKINVKANKDGNKQEKYLYLRQTTHNTIIKEANQKLKTELLSYPYGYAITTPSNYKALAKSGYKYVLYSQAYTYEHIMSQPADNEIVIFEYFIYDIEGNTAYKVFEMNELQIYSFKIIMKKLKKAIKNS